MKKLLPKLIFSAKYLLIPFYLKLFYTLLKMLYYFYINGNLNNEQLIQTLEDVDIVMIANLVKMIITGSYNSSVDDTHGIDEDHVSPGVLKVKLSTSIIGVSSIHLLQTFIGSNNISMETVYKQIAIHIAFIIGAIALAYIDWIHCKEQH